MAKATFVAGWSADRTDRKEADIMRTLAKYLACAAVVLPAAAWAQGSSDVAYCSALAQKYQRYVGDNDARHRGQQRNAAADAAVSQCSTNSASSIAVLEKALNDAKVELPPRT